MQETFIAKTDKEKDFIHIIADSLAGLRPIHMKVLRVVSSEGGKASPQTISTKLECDEIELRGVVRRLELEGMLEWIENDPDGEMWKIREFGMAIDKFAFHQGKKEELK